MIGAVLVHRLHPEQGFRTCLGVLRLFRGLAPVEAEAVSARALEIGARTYKAVSAVLANRSDLRRDAGRDAVIDHANVRGPTYFH